MTSDLGDNRPVWQVGAPPGGWSAPWPQLIELAETIPSTQWTLIGGLMVALHASYAGMPLTRSTRDIDMILHLETGAATWSGVQGQLELLGYRLREPVGKGNVHRFNRGSTWQEQVDVMVADHLAPSHRPRALRRHVFAVPGGTSALRKTVNCIVQTGSGDVVISVPDTLGALVLKGAAYKSDPRDRNRHIDDAALLACTITNPATDRTRMEGSDRSRIQALWNALQDRDHPAWISTGDWARRGHTALRVLSTPP